jgi:hypothetical protein
MNLAAKFADAVTHTILSHKNRPFPGNVEMIGMELQGWRFGADAPHSGQAVGTYTPVEITDPRGEKVEPADHQYLKAVRAAWATTLLRRDLKIS